MSYLWTYFYAFNLRLSPIGVTQELCFQARTREHKGTLEALTGRSVYFGYWNECCKVLSCETQEPGVLLVCIARPSTYRQDDPAPGDGRYKVF